MKASTLKRNSLFLSLSGGGLSRNFVECILVYSYAPIVDAHRIPSVLAMRPCECIPGLQAVHFTFSVSSTFFLAISPVYLDVDTMRGQVVAPSNRFLPPSPTRLFHSRNYSRRIVRRYLSSLLYYIYRLVFPLSFNYRNRERINNALQLNSPSSKRSRLFIHLTDYLNTRPSFHSLARSKCTLRNYIFFAIFAYR